MLPFFDFTHPCIASLDGHKSKFQEELQVLLAQRTVKNANNPNSSPYTAPVCYSLYDPMRLKTNNATEDLKNYKGNFIFGNNFHSFPTVPIFSPFLSKGFPETNIQNKNVKTPTDSKIKTVFLDNKFANQPQDTINLESPKNTTEQSRMSSSSCSSVECPVLQPPKSAQNFTVSKNLGPRQFENFYHPSPTFLSPAFWKLSNMMLANHLTNNSFMQTENHSRQMRSNEEFQFKAFETKRSEKKLLKTSGICPYATSNFLKSEQNPEKSFSEQPDLSKSKPYVESTANDFGKIHASPCFVSDRKNCSASNDFYQLPFFTASKLSVRPSIPSKDFQEATYHKDDPEVPLFNNFFTNLPSNVTQNALLLPWNNKPYLPATEIFNPKSSFSANVIDRKSTSSSAHLHPHSGGPMKEKRAHRCCYCGKLYSRKYGLKIHIRTHTGYKPLKCKVSY